MTWLSDPAGRALTNALDGLVRRQSVVAANLANIDTPGYQPMSVDFETTLRQELSDGSDSSGQAPPEIGPSAPVALRTTDPRHIPFVSPGAGPGSTAGPFNGSLRNDGNRVDLESEMTALAESQLKFAAVSRLLSGKLGMLRDVAGGR